MGLLDAALAAHPRFFSDLLPIGYERREFKWVFDIDLEKSIVTRNQKAFKKGEMGHSAPKAPGSKTSGIVPTLLVDDAAYVLPGFDSAKHIAWRELHNSAVSAPLQKAICLLVDKCSQDHQLTANVESKDVVAFRWQQDIWPFDEESLRGFWTQHLQAKFAGDDKECCLCGERQPSLRILPFNLRLCGQKVPLVAVNTIEQPAFASCGKEQLANSPVCFRCIAKAQQVLQHLLVLDVNENGKQRASGRHRVDLMRDDERPLLNQVAVFWTKEAVQLETPNAGASLVFEDMNRLALEAPEGPPPDGPPPEATQLRSLLEAPFAGGTAASNLATNRFYLAVLSPNKSRLVVREWLEEDVAKARDHLKRYMDALQIIHPDGRGIWFPPLPALLMALQSPTSSKRASDEKPRLAQVEPELMRQLLRCMYSGASPPNALLSRAVRCFRVAEPSTDQREQRERQMLRRMVLAAAMKLVLIFDRSTDEQKAMEQLVTTETSDYKVRSPFLCGRLLAILETIQNRASSSGKGTNTTLVDRYYGTASTAPASVFANLIGMATKAHLPKLRREGMEFFRTRHSPDKGVSIHDLLTEVCDALNEAGGFPPPLSPEEQAQFALGFYHQRAELSPPSKSRPNPVQPTQPQGASKS